MRRVLPITLQLDHIEAYSWHAGENLIALYWDHHHLFIGHSSSVFFQGFTKWILKDSAVTSPFLCSGGHWPFNKKHHPGNNYPEYLNTKKTKNIQKHLQFYLERDSRAELVIYITWVASQCHEWCHKLTLKFLTSRCLLDVNGTGHVQHAFLSSML